MNNPVEEMDSACRQTILDNHSWMQEWVDRRSLEPHVFGDILEQVPKESIPESLDFFARRDVVQKLPLKKNQFCYSHGKNCQLPKAGEVDIDVSGMPCQENSRINLNRLFMEGKNGVSVLGLGQIAPEKKNSTSCPREYSGIFVSISFEVFFPAVFILRIH